MQPLKYAIHVRSPTENKKKESFYIQIQFCLMPVLPLVHVQLHHHKFFLLLSYSCYNRRNPIYIVYNYPSVLQAISLIYATCYPDRQDNLATDCFPESDTHIIRNVVLHTYMKS